MKLEGQPLLIEQLDLLASKPLRSDYGRKCAVQLMAILEANGGWMTRLQLKECGLTPRLCRLGRQHSEGRIICGQRGYRTTVNATLEEIFEAAVSMKAQATTLMAEVQELWRVINQRQKPQQ